MATSPKSYALGRNTYVYVTIYNDIGAVLVPRFGVCISDGSLSFTADVITIPNNCNNGWKIKLPGNKEGSIRFTGHIADSSHEISDGIGQIAYLEIDSYDSEGNLPLVFQSDAICTGLDVGWDAEGNVRCEASFELSGEPTSLTGFTVAGS